MNTYKGSVLTLALKTLIEQNAPSLYPGGVDAVRYGDQRIINVGRLICVEPSAKTRDFSGTTQLTTTLFTTNVIVYVSGDGGNEGIQQVADELTEAVEDLLNTAASNPNLGIGGDFLGGLINDGFVSQVEHGYRVPASRIIRANKITFSSRSRNILVEE